MDDVTTPCESRDYTIDLTVLNEKGSGMCHVHDCPSVQAACESAIEQMEALFEGTEWGVVNVYSGIIIPLEGCPLELKA